MSLSAPALQAPMAHRLEKHPLTVPRCATSIPMLYHRTQLHKKRFPSFLLPLPFSLPCDHLDTAVLPQASPRVSPGRRGAPSTHQGSTASPGEPFLALAARWLALLACAAAQGPLPAPALSLMDDLVQLLHYHSPRVPAATGECALSSCPATEVTHKMLPARVLSAAARLFCHPLSYES